MSEEKREYSRAALVGIITGGESEESVNTALDELTRLLETAGGEATVRLTQKLQSPNPATLIGEGKLGELYWLCKDNGVEIAVFDSELSPSQIRNIENVLGDVRVIDRVAVFILRPLSKAREKMRNNRHIRGGTAKSGIKYLRLSAKTHADCVTTFYF